MSIFEKAARSKLRFEYKGSQSVEDLFDLPLEVKRGKETIRPLNDIYRALKGKLKKDAGDDLFGPKDTTDHETELKIDIVKSIVATKLAEREDRVTSKDRADKKSRILELIAKKQCEADEGKTIEELQKMAAEL